VTHVRSGTDCRIGVAISQDERESASELKHQADAAMYAAKRAGGDRVRLFEANTASVLERLCPPWDR
jgi:GGDEF domain-containing protein